MKKLNPRENNRSATRRSFMKRGIVAAGAAAAGAGLMGRGLSASGRQPEDDRLTSGDVAILRLLAAAEIIEADLWLQYNELGGVDAAASGYTVGQLDGDICFCPRQRSYRVGVPSSCNFADRSSADVAGLTCLSIA